MITMITNIINYARFYSIVADDFPVDPILHGEGEEGKLNPLVSANGIWWPGSLSEILFNPTYPLFQLVPLAEFFVLI